VLAITTTIYRDQRNGMEGFGACEELLADLHREGGWST
jgi:hypothetical protein